MTDRVADWRLLGLGFWQAWQIVAMCTDIVAPTSGKLFDQGSALLILLVLMTAAYLAVVVASRRYAPFAGRDSSLRARGGAYGGRYARHACCPAFSGGNRRHWCVRDGCSVGLPRQRPSPYYVGASCGVRWPLVALAAISTPPTRLRSCCFS
ncbi:MAG: hypothetical protein ACLTDR_00880 [Adlercreutzia equolifaciens]